MATSTLQVNDNNDLFLADGRNLSVITDVAACQQDIRLQTLMRTTEDIYDVKSGVGYFEFIFTPQQSYDDARKSLATAILSSPDVISIEQLNITIDGNTFNYDATVMTIYGPTTVSNN